MAVLQYTRRPIAKPEGVTLFLEMFVMPEKDADNHLT